MNPDPGNDRTFASILAETREDIRQFFETRISLFREESRQKVKVITRTLPLAVLALMLLATAYLMFTMAVVGLVLGLLPGNPFRWCLAFLAVGVLWSIAGGIAAWMAKRRFALKELMPNRTIGVLKEDGVWIQSEVKNQI